MAIPQDKIPFPESQSVVDHLENRILLTKANNLDGSPWCSSGIEEVTHRTVVRSPGSSCNSWGLGVQILVWRQMQGVAFSKSVSINRTASVNHGQIRTGGRKRQKSIIGQTSEANGFWFGFFYLYLFYFGLTLLMIVIGKAFKFSKMTFTNFKLLFIEI